MRMSKRERELGRQAICIIAQPLEEYWGMDFEGGEE